MDDQSNNNSANNATSRNLEVKIRRERINKGKVEETNIKTPRRYNPVNNNLNDENGVNNAPLNNDLDFQNKNAPAFQNDDEKYFTEGTEDTFIDQDVSDELENPEETEETVKNSEETSEPNKEENGQVENQNNQVPNNNRLRRNNQANNQATIANDPTQRKLNRINNQKKQQQEEAKNKEGESPKEAPTSSAQPNTPEQNKPKTKGSAPGGSSTTSEKVPGVGDKVNKLNQVKNSLESAMSKEGEKNDLKEAAKEKVKQKVKQKVVEKVTAFIANVLLPLLPYIGFALLIMFLLLVLIYGVISVFSDEENVVNTIKINYCEQVNIKWGNADDQNVTVSSDDFIKYRIMTSDYSKITNPKALYALVIVLRTNLYANSNNLDSNTCYFEVREPYTDESTDDLDTIVKATDNRVFSVSKNTLAELKIDENFTYSKIENDKYRLFQDKMSYDKAWVDQNIPSNHISSNTSSVELNSYSPFGAWYLAEEENYTPLSLIFHYITPGYYKGNIYKVEKITSGGGYGDYDGSCNDISLTMTPLERSEFIEKVNSYGNNSSGFEVFKKNAGKIYDISTNNNFNPEMVVIRGIVEGLSPGGSTNNFWGIGCSNTGGGKDCITYPSFDQGVLGYINTVKKMNSVSLFQMQRKYAYIGAYWYNPGNSSAGGCYYYPYIKKYLSEARADEVGNACASGKSCNTNGVGDCLKSTDEDQDAYTRYQIESMLQKRFEIFNISADECSEEEGPTEDVPASELGKAVAAYAVKTYDSWRYSQANRHQNGYVDCSSMVSRAYLHFNVKIFSSADTSGEIYRWCEQNGKTISGSSLAEGDLIFYNKGSHNNSDHYKGIGHVAMYIGNGKRFAANGQYTSDGKTRPVADQVSVSSYTGNGSLFCRPSSA